MIMQRVTSKPEYEYVYKAIQVSSLLLSTLSTDLHSTLKIFAHLGESLYAMSDHMTSSPDSEKSATPPDRPDTGTERMGFDASFYSNVKVRKQIVRVSNAYDEAEKLRHAWTRSTERTSVSNSSLVTRRALKQ
jgi:hypothetical protein